MKKIYGIGGIIAVALLTYFVIIPSFLGSLEIDPILRIGPLTFRWYGLILAASILLGYFVVRKNSWKFGISKNDVDDFSFWVVLISILGARIYYVVFSLPYFLSQPDEIYKIWHGGLSIYGAVLAGIIFAYFYCKKKAYNFWQLADLVALGLPLAQALGRFGNFVNQEAFGIPTNLPWKMFVGLEHRPSEYVQYDFFHPAFLYEGIASVLIFLILYKFLGKLKSGGLFLLYIFAYSLSRFFIEAIRVDSFFLGGFRVDQLIAFVLVIASGIWFYKRQLS